MRLFCEVNYFSVDFFIALISQCLVFNSCLNDKRDCFIDGLLSVQFVELNRQLIGLTCSIYRYIIGSVIHLVPVILLNP